MSAARHLRVLDGDGEILEIDDPATENRALRAALTRAENVIKGLKSDKAHERKQYADRGLIEDAFNDWKTKLVAAGHKGKARCKLSDDRFDAIKAMIEAGYTLADFELVNTGIAEFQFVVYGKRRQQGSEDAREVDIAYVCDKARRFEEAARLGAFAEKAKQA